ncbi:MAG: DnaJ domain-containing protein [Alphaproteobacteria bacterium]|nr:DnaJ domain-containing protein [Alphaproteobacteria bacterium]
MSWFAVILVIALIILFLRFGLPHMAAITSFGAVAIAWIRRLRQAKISVNKANAAFKKKTAEHIMHTDEARSILGLEANATAEDINKAHHQLIQKNHPDTGGSEYLASKINEARDVLLKELSK